MIRVLVTGADGFIGRVLVQRLLAQGLDGRTVDQIVAADLRSDDAAGDARVVQRAGDLCDPTHLDALCAQPLDAVFHLASLPGGAAEADYERGRRVNLDATIALLERLRGQSVPARFIYASSVAVYGDPLPERIDEATLPAPALSYGAHKLACEVLVADASRRRWVEGCSLRLPGVVARPGEGAGLMSAFMSQVFWRLAAGEPVTLPVSPEGVAWWISVSACVDNLLRAACVDPQRLHPRRSYPMPVLRLTMADVVAALCARFGRDSGQLVRYAPEPLVERLFARYPPLDTAQAEALGFRHDGSVEALIRHALAIQPAVNA